MFIRWKPSRHVPAINDVLAAKALLGRGTSSYRCVLVRTYRDKGHVRQRTLYLGTAYFDGKEQVLPKVFWRELEERILERKIPEKTARFIRSEVAKRCPKPEGYRAALKARQAVERRQQTRRLRMAWRLRGWVE